jgi:hypothetical protein
MTLVRAALILFFVAQPARAAVDDDVRAVFQSYKRLLLAMDGEKCATVVDRATRDYYQRMRDLALKGSAAKVQALPIIDKLMVVRIRHEVPLALIKKMDGPKLFAYGVQRGWVSRDSVTNGDIGQVEAAGPDFATAVFTVQGKPTPLKIEFRKEDGAWRVGLLSLFRPGEIALRQLQSKSGMSEDEFVLDLVGKLAEKPPTAKVWEPLER